MFWHKFARFSFLLPILSIYFCLNSTKYPVAGNGSSQIPALVSPTNGATGQPVALALTWDTVAGATSYSIQVSTTSTFATGSDLANQVDLQQPSDSISGLAPGTTYYWEVGAVDTSAAPVWSKVWSFTTAASPVSPLLAAPTNGAAGQPTSLLASWGSIAGATSYAIQVSTAVTFASTVLNQAGLEQPSDSIKGLSGGTTYYWEVNATGPAGTGSWSAPDSFMTLAVPATPTLMSPSDGAVNEQTSLTLTWTSSSNAATYAVQVSTVTGFTSTVTAQIQLTVTSASIGGLASGTTYYWRAGAKNVGGVSSWSTPDSFTTLAAAPTAPLLIAPSSGSVNQPIALTISWTSVAGAATYGILLATDSTFATTVSSQSGLTGNSASLTGLADSTQYFWEVNAVNAGGTSPWSYLWNFTTIP
jgi:hypothetical protein